MTTLIKLGGSLVTDKTQPKAFRRDAARDIAAQLAALRGRKPDLRIVLGHGSGSFGHVEARKYGTRDGVETAAQWLGFAKVGAVAVELSQLIQAELLAAELPVMRFQPSSMLQARGGWIDSFDSKPIEAALGAGLIPLIHGDIALDQQIGGTIISTESLFARLVEPLQASQIVLLGEVDGVLDAAGAVIPRISPASFPQVAGLLGEARGADVTGGMLQKAREMLDLVAKFPDLRVVIANGLHPNIINDLMTDSSTHCTRIEADGA